ncbi:hypothetical protein F4823DRAFT_631496 [Ustulina deusta]|nr:hypothetical protein F4823DRAFT_631496 [Ustulina deusta]
MASQSEREIKTLKEIADTYWEDQLSLRAPKRTYETPHDAESITRLVTTNCLAVLEPSSPRMRNFIKRCIILCTYEMSAIEGSQAEFLLTECFWQIDQLFFFGLLTRKVDHMLDGPRNLVVLKFPPKAEPYYGLFSDGVMTIWLRIVGRGSQSFVELLFCLIRLCCTAWLRIFSDKRHPMYREMLRKHFWHGEMFQKLFTFVAGYITNRIPRNTFKNPGYFQLGMHLEQKYIDWHKQPRKRYWLWHLVNL